MLTLHFTQSQWVLPIHLMKNSFMKTNYFSFFQTKHSTILSKDPNVVSNSQEEEDIAKGEYDNFGK